MRVWHNIGHGMDVVEYIEGKLYGVVEYKEGKEELGNHRWLATMLTYEDVIVYINWCDFECDKEIYNRITKKLEDDDWV